MSPLEQYLNSLPDSLNMTRPIRALHKTDNSISFLYRPFLRFVKVTCGMNRTDGDVTVRGRITEANMGRQGHYNEPEKDTKRQLRTDSAQANAKTQYFTTDTRQRQER